MGAAVDFESYTHTNHYFDTNRAIIDTFGGAGYPVPEEHVQMRQIAVKAA
jgi:small conductance mechanosensitive channel